MKVVVSQTCLLKSLFSACGADSIAQCQYCGRTFCERHGVVLEDGQQICSRKECVAKKEDLARHLAYKEAVSIRNREQACGIYSCEKTLAAQCVRCKGLFCGVHVRRREEIVLENQVRVARLATLCQHCNDRRAIWLRT